MTPLIRKIQRVFQTLPASEGSILTAVYVFGSFAKGRQKAASDIDMAFVFNEHFYKQHPFEAFQKAELLGFAVGRETKKNIDVSVLNSSSLAFAYHTVRDGICVYEDNPADRLLYEVAAENKYLDFMPFIRELRDRKREPLIGSH